MDVPIIRMRVKSQGQDWGDDDKGMVIIYNSRVEDIWGDDDTDKKMTAVWTSR